MKIFLMLSLFSFSAFAGLTPQKYCEKIYNEDGVACEVLNVDVHGVGVLSGSLSTTIAVIKYCIGGMFKVLQKTYLSNSPSASATLNLQPEAPALSVSDTFILNDANNCTF